MASPSSWGEDEKASPWIKSMSINITKYHPDFLSLTEKDRVDEGRYSSTRLPQRSQTFQSRQPPPNLSGLVHAVHFLLMQSPLKVEHPPAVTQWGKSSHPCDSGHWTRGLYNCYQWDRVWGSHGLCIPRSRVTPWPGSHPLAASVTPPTSLQRQRERSRRVRTSRWAWPHWWDKTIANKKKSHAWWCTCLWLNGLCVLPHLILTTALWGKCSLTLS